jgi:hypothetical protein
MNSTRIITAIGFILITLSINSRTIDPRESIRNNFPSLEEVLSFLNNALLYECQSCQYGIAKKESGYFLTYRNFISKESDEQLIWSSANNKFVESVRSDYANMNRPRSQANNEFSELYNQREKFDFMFFYGYDNWAQDIVNFLKPMKDSLSAEDLENMARANDELAKQAINQGNQFRKYKTLRTEDAEKASAYAQNSMEYWAAIKKINPKYTPLIIEDLDLKIGNENMHFYNLFNSVKMENKANYFLSRAWYPECYIQSAKNLLFSCSIDAFLITQGDSDTYPLWYVQKKQNYRNDVVVINAQLLYTPWFLQMNKERYKYNSLLDQNSYAALLKKGMYWDNKQEKVPFKNWLSQKVQTSDTSTLLYDLVPKAFIIPFKGSNLNVKMNGNFFAHNDLAILDIISSNPARDFNFTSPFQMYLLGLVEYYLERGKSFHLTPKIQPFKSDKESIRQLDNLMLYTEVSYLNALKHSGAYELNFVCYGIQELPPLFNTDKMRLIEELMNQLPISQIIKMNNLSMLESMSAFCSEVAPKQNEQLKNEARPILLDRIEEMSVLNKAFEKDIQNMEEIFSIYAGIRLQWVKFEPPKIAPSDQFVLDALYKKVQQFLNNPVIENRHWSELKLQALIKGLENLELN